MRVLERGNDMKYLDEYRDAELVHKGIGRDPPHRHAPVVADGNLRRADALDHAARPRRTAAATASS